MDAEAEKEMLQSIRDTVETLKEEAIQTGDTTSIEDYLGGLEEWSTSFDHVHFPTLGTGTQTLIDSLPQTIKELKSQEANKPDTTSSGNDGGPSFVPVGLFGPLPITREEPPIEESPIQNSSHTQKTQDTQDTQDTTDSINPEPIHLMKPKPKPKKKPPRKDKKSGEDPSDHA